MLWRDVQQSPDQVFEDGVYVGNIRFSGGFIVVEVDGGMQNRSSNIDFEREESYATQIRSYTDQVFGSALSRHHVVPLEALEPTGWTLPSRRPFRGTDKLDDGHDNQNLPRFTLTPTAWTPLPEVPANVQAVVAPIIVHYYSHNGGWFYGQRFGSTAGARLRVFWTLFDAQTGAVLSWGDIQTKETLHGLYSPNSAQVEDFLISVEEQMSREVSRRLP
ncbi:MAG: hypothetical protein HN348_04305 [Proteobacteria bacterium]|nr:hypothetical protein [Pseudomonadota bacterium]